MYCCECWLLKSFFQDFPVVLFIEVDDSKIMRKDLKQKKKRFRFKPDDKLIRLFDFVSVETESRRLWCSLVESWLFAIVVWDLVHWCGSILIIFF